MKRERERERNALVFRRVGKENTQESRRVSFNVACNASKRKKERESANTGELLDEAKKRQKKEEK